MVPANWVITCYRSHHENKNLTNLLIQRGTPIIFHRYWKWWFERNICFQTWLFWDILGISICIYVQLRGDYVVKPNARFWEHTDSTISGKNKQVDFYKMVYNTQKDRLLYIICMKTPKRVNNGKQHGKKHMPGVNVCNLGVVFCCIANFQTHVAPALLTHESSNQ